MLFITVFIGFWALFSIIYLTLYFTNYNKILLEERVRQVKFIIDEKDLSEEDKSFIERVIMPSFNAFRRPLTKFKAKDSINILSKKLARAGLLKKTTVEKWILKKTIISVGYFMVTGILTYLVDNSILKSSLFAFISLIVVNVYSNFHISKLISLRKVRLTRDLPYVLDMITVSVEAGLSFDGALSRVVNNINCDLSYEFAKTLKEVKMGIERKIALRNMSERLEVRELSTLITSLIQADELGVSLSKVLRIESSGLREYRKQAAREKAMKAPVKMLFPLIFFIFPSIFVIILGPAVIKIFEIF